MEILWLQWTMWSCTTFPHNSSQNVGSPTPVRLLPIIATLSGTTEFSVIIFVQVIADCYNTSPYSSFHLTKQASLPQPLIASDVLQTLSSPVCCFQITFLKQAGPTAEQPRWSFTNTKGREHQLLALTLLEVLKAHFQHPNH